MNIQELYASKLVSAETAAAVVKSGDWVDYGWCVGTPVTVDKAIAKRLPELTDVDVLKVGHHGSKYSTCQEFVDRICPEGAVISCAAKNRYGHPSDQVVRRLEEAGCALGFTIKD